MKDIKEIFADLNIDTKRIFDIVQKNGPITKNDISDLSGFKLTTLIRIMQPLLDTGLVVESSIGESTGGRRPVLYHVNSGRYYIIGIDISRTYTQIVIVNLKMEIVEKVRFKMDDSTSPEVTVELIHKALSHIRENRKLHNEMILGVGVGTVGPMDRDKGIILDPIKFKSKGWERVPIKSMLYEKLGIPVIIDNGANAAVVSETYYGCGKGYKNVVYLNLGVGIRTGAIASGTLIRTINDSEDVFAHMVIDVDGEKCSCGNYGCIECYSSISAITDKFVSEIKKGRTTIISKDVGDVDFTQICTAAQRGDALAKEILQGAAVILGTGLANFVNLINPELVVLSGPLINNSRYFFDECTKAALRKSYYKKDQNICFSYRGYFEENAISVGAAALVVESVLENSVVKDVNFPVRRCVV
jgi:predicted NBD/HSP70 family sugar kinase